MPTQLRFYETCRIFRCWLFCPFFGWRKPIKQGKTQKRHVPLDNFCAAIAHGGYRDRNNYSFCNAPLRAARWWNKEQKETRISSCLKIYQKCRILFENKFHVLLHRVLQPFMAQKTGKWFLSRKGQKIKNSNYVNFGHNIYIYFGK